MRYIKRQFGAKFAEALSKCPTLVKDLSEIRKAGIKIRRFKGHEQAYSELRRMRIMVSTGCSMTYALVALAHEKVHLLVTPTPPPVPGFTTRRQFIDRGIKSEVDAICHEVKVVGELLAAGYEVDSHSMSWYRRFQRGGKSAIKKALLRKTVTSNTGENYRDYYGNWYDEVIDGDNPSPSHRRSVSPNSADADSPPIVVLNFSKELRAALRREPITAQESQADSGPSDRSSSTNPQPTATCGHRRGNLKRVLR